MAKFTKKFETGTFGVRKFGDTYRWSLTFTNGNTRYSNRSFQSEAFAREAVSAYIEHCKQKQATGSRVWVVYDVLSTKTGKNQHVFTNAHII